MSDNEVNSPVREKTLTEQDVELVPLSEEEVLVPGIADKHPKDMPEMAFIIAFCIQYNEAVGNMGFLPEELEDAIVCREPVDLVERVHRYFLRNVLNVSKIIDKRYWIRKLSQHLHERIERKEFIFSYNPFDRVDNVYHELSNFEKVMILKDLVMWQFKESEKIQEMWQSKESERVQSLRDQETENVVRPVEVEVLGVDSKGSTYFYLGAGSRIYRETPSDGECIWEPLTTTLQDLKDLVSERIEIDPDRSEKESLLYERISKELIPDIEAQIEEERAAEEAAMIRRGGKRVREHIRYKRKVHSLVEDTENIQASVEGSVPDENTESSLNADEPILSVSMWSVTRPPTNLQPAQTVHDIKCLPVNQEASSSSVTANSNGIITSTTEIPAELPEISSASEDDVATTILSSNQSNFSERQNYETSNNITVNKRRMEEEISDDNYSYSSDSNKRVKFYDDDYYDEDEEDYDNEDYDDDDYCDDEDGYDDDDDDVDIDEAEDDFDVDYASCYANTTKRPKRAIKEKGKEVLRDELRNISGPRNVYINKFTPFAKSKVDKGKGVFRLEESSRIGEGNSVSHGYNTANITKLPEGEIFRPGPEDQMKLEWSLNHIFFEGLEIFGEDSDSELSDCCDDCMIEN